MSNSEQVKYQIKNGYTLRHFLDEYLVIPVGLSDDVESKVGILNEVGEVLWQTLQNEVTLKDMLNAVTNEFEVTEEIATKDIEEFLEQLKEYNFLEIR